MMQITDGFSRLISPTGIKNVFGKDIECETKIRRCKLEKKYKYLMPLDKEMREKIQPLAQPYPKRTKQAMTGTTGTAAVQRRPVRSIEAA